jgi:hypothetical protein
MGSSAAWGCRPRRTGHARPQNPPCPSPPSDAPSAPPPCSPTPSPGPTPVAREHAGAGDLAQPSVRDLEWQLLELLTGRRRSHPAGSAPVLLDRLFAGLDDDEVQRILGRLEPLARGVQVLVLDDHPAAAAWAVTAGAGTAAVVRATTAPAGGASPTMRPSAT